MKDLSMPISSAGATSALPAQHEVMNAWVKQQKAMQQLNAALKAGDVPEAQNIINSMTSSPASRINTNTLHQIKSALQNSDLAAAQKLAVSLTTNRSANPSSAQAQAQNNQTAEVLSMQRGQGGQVNVLA